MKTQKAFLATCILSSFLGVLSSPADASEPSGLDLTVEVIKADRTSTVDPQLKALVKELAPVLNYTGFSLVKRAELPMKPNQTSEVLLPSNRLMEMTFLGFEGQEARVVVRIKENNRETFRSTLILVDKGSVLIGGPPHEGGVLLLRITGVFKP
jgi:hypothetical protein